MPPDESAAAPADRGRPTGLITQNDVGTTEEELMAAIDATLKGFSEGDIVTGKVVKIDKDEILIDIGWKSEGVVPIRELSIRNDVNPWDVVKEGDDIEALILQIEDAEGRMVLSKKRAQYERSWGRIEELKRSGEIVNGLVIEVVKGGLIVDIGLRGFLPASLVELRRVRDLHPYVGKELECKIIELDRNRNNVVLSRRAYLEESQSIHRKEFLENLKVGERRKGVVSSLVNFGAFVDLGGVDGLVHVSELSWQHVEHPSEIVKVGDEIDVEVLHVDLERDRVSLSFKITQEDPWRAFARSNQPGDVVTGKITRLVPFGAFVELGSGVEGLTHISELSDEHVEMAEQVVSVGQEVSVRVLDVDLERRRISLSLKRAAEPSYTVGSIEIEREPIAIGPPEAEMEREPEVTAEAEPAPSAGAAAPAEEKELEPEPVSPAEGKTEEKAQEPASEEPETPEPEPEPDEELGGELLDRESAPKEESLESIVEEMKRDRGA